MAAELFAYLSYRDAPAALTWLEALGFELVARHDDERGGVQHAEVRLDSVALMIATADRPYELPPLIGSSTGGGLYLCTDDVDALYEKAIAAGAQTVFPPEATGWGARRARILDAEGHEWSFGSHRPGER